MNKKFGKFMEYEPEGIKYMGSKSKILNKIMDVVLALDLPEQPTLLDAFSGSTRVAQYFKKNGFNVTANDLNIWSKTFADCYIVANNNLIDINKIDRILNELNELPGIHGWFSDNYGGTDNGNKSSIQDDGKKRIWQEHNTIKLDAIRDRISELKSQNEINDIEESVLLTSLINALDKVENTMGHFVSYLNNWSPRSYKTMVLKKPKLLLETTGQSSQGDAFDSITKYHDVMYFDPPYGSSNDKMPSSRVRYGQYYHIWKTIILNDKPNLIGEINKRSDANVLNTYSIFEEYKKNKDNTFIAFDAIKRLINEANCKHIVFSYNNNSRVAVDDILAWVSSEKMNFNVFFLEHSKNVMAHCNSTNEWTELAHKKNFEMLLIITKDIK